MGLMKAVVLREHGEPSVLRVQEINPPTPNENEVLIKVLKTSVNFADLKARRGSKGSQLPTILGLDAVGIIEQIGNNVTSLEVGQRVITFPKNGSYAEYIIGSETLTYPIPATIDVTTAAASPIVSFLSYHLLKNVANIKKGDNVLIHSGSGGVGTAAIQLAKHFGAGKVYATVGNLDKQDIPLSFGANEVLTYETFDTEINRLTNNNGVDVVLDSVAGDVTRKSLNCLSHFGRLVQFGNSSGEPSYVKTSEVHSSCRSLLGFSLGTARKEKPELLKEMADDVINLIASRALTFHVEKEFHLENAKEAHTLIENRKHRGKVLLNV